MRILIYGAGALGLGIASCILRAGNKVDIVAREDTVSSLRTNGLVRTGIFGDLRAEPETFHASSSLKDLSQERYDLIMVCTKSYDTLNAAIDIASCPALINKKTIIVLCQNGWGNAETFADYLPKERIFNGRVITGFYRPEKNHVHITVHASAIRMGSLFSGELPEHIESLCQMITRGGIPCESTGSIGKDLWAKMLYNCALNPLGAIFNVPYGVLGEQDYSKKIMKDITEEIFRVMNNTGYTTYWSNAGDFLDAFYKDMLPPTAKHESSMLQDIRANKRTEIDALNGQIVGLGEKHKVSTPVNSVIYNMMKFLEERNR